MNIRAILYDFDGVMTDNKVLVSEDGKESVLVNRSDGLAISYFKKLEIDQAIVSSESNKVVKQRARKLDIEVHQNVQNKYDFVKKLLIKKKLKPSEVFFVGNDLNDLEVINYLPQTFCPKMRIKKFLIHRQLYLIKKEERCYHGALRTLFENFLG